MFVYHLKRTQLLNIFNAQIKGLFAQCSGCNAAAFKSTDSTLHDKCDVTLWTWQCAKVMSYLYSISSSKTRVEACNWSAKLGSCCSGAPHRITKSLPSCCRLCLRAFTAPSRPGTAQHATVKQSMQSAHGVATCPSCISVMEPEWHAGTCIARLGPFFA